MFAFQVFELSDVVHLNIHVCFAAQLALPGGKPVHQTCFAGIHHSAGNIIYSTAVQTRLSRKSIMIEQSGFALALFVSKANAKVFPIRNFAKAFFMLMRYFAA